MEEIVVILHLLIWSESNIIDKEIVFKEPDQCYQVQDVISQKLDDVNEVEIILNECVEY